MFLLVVVVLGSEKIALNLKTAFLYKVKNKNKKIRLIEHIKLTKNKNQRQYSLVDLFIIGMVKKLAKKKMK